MRNWFAIFFLLFALLSTSASAHPHVWVTYLVKPSATAAGIDKVYFTWRFDAMFSAMALEELQIKSVTEKDWPALRDKAFANLKNYHYYTHIKADGVDFAPDTVGDFKAHMTGKQLVYEFSITLPKPAKDLEVSIWDEEFYVDLDPPTEEVVNDKAGSAMSERQFKAKEFIAPQAVAGAAKPDCKSEERSRDNPIWGKVITFYVLCKAK
jgi:ABC-type uncharacterized transport system substrate-binding protein